MASTLQAILAKIVELINAPGKPSNLIVSRSWALVGDLANEPDKICVVVRPGKATNETKGGPRNYICERETFVMIQIGGSAATGESFDQTLDPACCWVTKQLATDPTLGGIARFTRDVETVWTNEQTEHNTRDNGKVHWLWAVQHLNKANDQESRP